MRSSDYYDNFNAHYIKISVTNTQIIVRVIHILESVIRQFIQKKRTCTPAGQNDRTPTKEFLQTPGKRSLGELHSPSYVLLNPEDSQL